MFINLTPHVVRVVDSVGNLITNIPPSGNLATIQTTTIHGCDHDGIPLSRTHYGELEGLPDPQRGVYLIVSEKIKSRLPYRNDLVIPSEPLKDRNGNLIGCMSLGL